jgi:hypothetical protein
MSSPHGGEGGAEGEVNAKEVESQLGQPGQPGQLGWLGRPGWPGWRGQPGLASLAGQANCISNKNQKCQCVNNGSFAPIVDTLTFLIFQLNRRAGSSLLFTSQGWGRSRGEAKTITSSSIKNGFE